MRTGPALNPLKGSSARLPHCLYYCIPEAKTNSFVFIFLSLGSRVKMLYPRENLRGGFPSRPRHAYRCGSCTLRSTVTIGKDHLAARILSVTGKPSPSILSAFLDPAEFSLLL